MKPLFKPEWITNVWRILMLMLVIKVVWFVVALVWLPTSGVDQSAQNGPKALYYRVTLSQNKASLPSQNKQPMANIKDIKLLAIYHAQDVVVVSVEFKGKTQVLRKGEQINGFKLEGAGSNYAKFSKNGVFYKIDLQEGLNAGKVSALATPSPTPSAQAVSGEIVDAGDHKLVDRSLLSHYTSNMDAVFKDIGIMEIKKGSEIQGFRVSFVRRGSHFEQLGLQKGDVIKSVNGDKMDSYNAAFSAYKNVTDASAVTLVVERGNQEMELEYEVN
ncbi:MAG: hypothetical protein RL113_1455 [Pseudomonadota bacterium]